MKAEAFEFHLDTDHQLPLWRQLYEQVTYAIEHGCWDIGEGLPSERELAEKLHISRGTVRRCYDELRVQQHLTGRGRKGSILQKPQLIQPKLGKLKSFTQEMAELGKTASTRIELLKIIQDIEVAKIFARPKSAEFLHIVRVRYGDQIPMSREVAWYDLTQAPDLRHWNGTGSVYQYLEQQCDIHLIEASQTVEACLSHQVENEAFGFEQASPCLLFKRKVFSQHQHLIEYVEGTFRGDLYIYSLDLSL